jgi:hypothetical protein
VALYLTVLEGADPLTAQPLFATDDKRVIAAVVREISKHFPTAIPSKRKPAPSAPAEGGK